MLSPFRPFPSWFAPSLVSLSRGRRHACGGGRAGNSRKHGDARSPFPDGAPRRPADLPRAGAPAPPFPAVRALPPPSPPFCCAGRGASSRTPARAPPRSLPSWSPAPLTLCPSCFSTRPSPFPTAAPASASHPPAPAPSWPGADETAGSACATTTAREAAETARLTGDRPARPGASRHGGNQRVFWPARHAARPGPAIVIPRRGGAGPLNISRLPARDADSTGRAPHDDRRS